MKKGHLNIAFPWVWSLPVKYQAKNVHVNSPGDLGELVRWPREKSSTPRPSPLPPPPRYVIVRLTWALWSIQF